MGRHGVLIIFGATAHSAAFKFAYRSIFFVHTTQNIQGVRLLKGNLECTYNVGWLLQLTLILPSVSFWTLIKHIFKVCSDSGPLSPQSEMPFKQASSSSYSFFCIGRRHLRQTSHKKFLMHYLFFVVVYLPLVLVSLTVNGLKKKKGKCAPLIVYYYCQKNRFRHGFQLEGKGMSNTQKTMVFIIFPFYQKKSQ